jgi:hypothetical protein
MLKNAKFGFHVAHNVSIFKLGGVQVWFLSFEGKFSCKHNRQTMKRNRKCLNFKQSVPEFWNDNLYY